MALPDSGTITFDDVNSQLRQASGSSIDMNDAQVRGLAGKPSGAIAMSNLHGKWAGEKMVCGTSGGYYGFSNSATGSFSAAKYGTLTNRNIFGKVPVEVAWYSGSLYFKLEPGETAPAATQLVIRDVNFGAVATVAIDASNWAEFGGLLNTAPLASNPFPSGATRWITWS